MDHLPKGSRHIKWQTAAPPSILLIAIVLLVSCGTVQKPILDVKPGEAAPEFSLKAVRGDMYSLGDLRGQSILLAFLNTQANAASDQSDPSRAQIVFLKSMQEQYVAQGLNVWIVDATQQTTGKQPSSDELINFTYNWQLDLIPVLIDEGANVATSFGISSTPTTFLIGPDGIIRQRWDSVAFSAQLALAIESIMKADDTTPSGTIACLNESLPQAKFTGVGLARPLSNEIWVVDNGKPWGIGGNYPLQWIVLDNSDKAGKSQLHLRVTGSYPDSESFVLIDETLALLPDDEMRGLLAVTSGNLPNVYFLTTTIVLNKPGCLRVQALVVNEETGTTLYNGEMPITVK